LQQEKAAKQNLLIMWFANFFIGGSMTMVIPFLSLYIETLGHHSAQYVQQWSAWVFGVTFVTAFIASPIWGRFGDRHGRKKILIIAAFGLAICVFLMGFVTSVLQLFILRLLMGIFTGFISMSQALISTQTPRHIAGRVLGTLQTGNVAGSLLGPMLAGMLADVGFRTTFHLTSITLLLAALFVLFGIKEFRIEEAMKETKKTYSSKEVFKHVLLNPMLMMVMVVALFVQVANFSIQPILALYVRQLHGPTNIAFFSGLAFSSAGLGNLFMARNWGKLGDRIGYEKILVVLVILAGIIYLPGAFVTSIWQLVIIRLFLGISLGGVIPVLVAYIRQVTPLAIQGEVMGYNTSVRFLGNIGGPALGGYISAQSSISNVFFSTSALLILSGVVLFIAVYRTSKNKPHHSRAKLHPKH
jgi:DHA1 family multidrug resistance protein-like MFS transporter